MQYRRVKIFSFILFIGLAVVGCGSTKEAMGFESILYPEGRPVTVKLKNEQADRRFDFYFLEANRFKMTGDYGNAAVYYTEALKVDSTCATCYFEIGNLLIQNNEFESAENYLFKSVQYDPTNEYFVYLLSKIYANNEKFDLALLSAGYLTEQHPDNVEYLYHLSQLHAHKGNYSNAIHTLNRIQSLLGINESITIEKHALFLEMGDTKSAEQEFIDLIEAYPHNSEYLLFLGDYYIQQEDFKKGYIIYNEVLESDGGNGQVYFSLANYAYLMKDTTGFKHHLKKGFEHPNVQLEAKIQRIMPFLMGLEEADNPISNDELNVYLRDMMTVHPYEASVHVLYGNFQKHVGNDSLAVSAYETALLIDEQQEDIWHEYLLLLFSESDQDKFLEEALRAIVLYPENGLFNYMAGFAHMMHEQVDEAIRFFTLTIENSEDNISLKSQVYGLLGDLYYQSEEADKSFEATKKV
ncbi:tetratricopeptide repeat protein [Geofilum rubicundum]|uniref:TPR repeat protein n=1 Tax=Geofilum rubicundum JCM 15548 TaxID=1236989 RepID=A0A0E9M159_9BACT|nr:tetratricopeptide repeat protein [Geofilum rubicundum]GAO31298.1 TPR repeat protein [Geofilum rubicundum JCM 15548]